ncbi:hypothetical protein BD410DRAFT_800407 [Rickenella mellea]|uniref:Uncharacterized protein n=1 Tax=Rickenella mellea TaxID=50990 RepID=A0A4Y7QH97_9AGAM|nr:hypothetical protein BD410DRAFT_800407 [Rickenella mellea]
MGFKEVARELWEHEQPDASVERTEQSPDALKHVRLWPRHGDTIRRLSTIEGVVAVNREERTKAPDRRVAGTSYASRRPYPTTRTASRDNAVSERRQCYKEQSARTASILVPPMGR